MKSFSQATIFLASCLSIASALFIPPLPSDITTVAGTTGPLHASINFKASCQGCFIGTDDGLELTLKVSTAAEECSGVAPHLNGNPLIPDRHEFSRKGKLVFPTELSNGLGTRQVEATWEMACLGDQASILSVKFHGLAGQTHVKRPSGFTVAFRQVGPPSILRLQGSPVDDVDDPATHDSWLRPEEHRPLTIVSPSPASAPALPNAMQHELHKLEALNSRVTVLQKEIHDTEKRIMSIFRAEFKSCSSWKCMWQTAMQKKPEFTQLISTHFGHRTKPDSEFCKGSTQAECLEVMVEQQETHGMPPLLGMENLAPVRPIKPLEPIQPLQPLEVVEPSEPLEHPSLDAPPPPPPPYPHHPEDGHRPPWAHSTGFNSPPHGQRPHYPEHPHPPFGPGRHRRPHGPPPFGHFHRHHRAHRWVVGAATVAVIALAVIVLFTWLWRNTQLFRDPRRRADRAARREERQTRRLYRKAACQHKWSKFWSGCRRPKPTSDYEEKRQMIREQEGVLDNVMEREITNLRTAHELVGELVRAEEGRARLYYEANLPPSQRAPVPTELEAGEGSSRQYETLPPYSIPPPTYEEELAGDLTVVDGFQGYTPSNTDDTPESSVIDCSPRLSFETQRTAFTRKSHD